MCLNHVWKYWTMSWNTVSSMHRALGARGPGCTGPRVHGAPGARALGCTGPRVHGVQMPRFEEKGVKCILPDIPEGQQRAQWAQRSCPRTQDKHGPLEYESSALNARQPGYRISCIMENRQIELVTLTVWVCDIQQVLAAAWCCLWDDLLRTPLKELRDFMLRNVTLRYVTLRFVTSRLASPHHVTLRYVMLWYATLRILLLSWRV